MDPNQTKQLTTKDATGGLRVDMTQMKIIN